MIGIVQNKIWQTPKKSRAERKIPRKSNNHFVGELTFGEELGQGQTVGFESKLEHDVGLLAIYSPGVIDLREQVKMIYTKADGRYVPHYIDFITTEQLGRRTALIVKPHFRAIQSKFRDLVSRLASAAIPRVVDRLVVATERVLEPLRLARVEQFHSCRFAQPEFDNILMNEIKHLDGNMKIQDFLNQIGIGNDGFHAVVRMVRFGMLDAPEPGLLKLSSSVQLPR